MQSDTKRLTQNTVFLYFRTILLLFIGVFTSRITLQALGVDNYGVVNVVSGFIGMFSIINVSLTGACQRFITYSLGDSKGDLKSVFSASVYIHIILTLIFITLAETIGLYAVNNILNLPKENHGAIIWLYQCSVISFSLSLLNIPYNSIIIAHEKLKVFAYISILEGVLKLGLALAILYIHTNTLMLYATLTLFSAIIVRATFQIYCRKTFNDSIKLTRKVNKDIIKKLFSFAGWTFIGNFATISSNQGVNIVINIFCGVAVNAARGLAMMVESVISSFVNNFTTALDPQITKSYARGEEDNLQKLSVTGLRITFYLMLFMAVPVIITSKEILHIWFLEVPGYTTIFVQLSLILAFIQAMGKPFLTILLATGNIRNYQLYAGTITFMNLPISYLLLYLGFSPTCVYITAITIMCMTILGRFYFIKQLTNLKIIGYFKLLLKLAVILLVSTIIIRTSYELFIEIDNIFKLAAFGILSILINAILIYACGLTHEERIYFRNLISRNVFKRA